MKLLFSRIITASAFCLALCFSTGTVSGAARVTDINKMQGILVDEGNELDKLAADTLSRYVEKIFGHSIAVNPEGIELSPDTHDVILVGRKTALAAGTITAEELEDVKFEGFFLRAKDGRISLAGYSGHGTVYAVYELLERWGCKFYSRALEIVPETEKSIIAEIDFSDKPFFERRTGRWWADRASVGLSGDPRQGMNPELFTKEAGSNLWIDHTAGYLVPKLLYYDKHPEYYAMRRNGERIPKSTSDNRIFLCTSNPDVRKIAMERMIGWMKLQPDVRYFFVTPGDGPDWCQCENCKALDQSPGDYADRYLGFVNHIARGVKEEFPDNRILTFAYTGTEYAPLEESPESNVIVVYCPYFGRGRSCVHSWTHPVNANSLFELEAWLAVAPESMGIAEYNLRYLPSWDAMAERLKWSAERGIRSVSSYGSPTCFKDMWMYMWNKLRWDPSLDPEELKADFVSAYYGAAAPRIMDYLDLVQKRLRDGYPKMVYQATMPPDYYSVSFTRKSLRFFDKALAAVEDDPVLLKRVQHEKDLFVGDYLSSVNLVTDGVCGRGIVSPPPSRRQRRHALGVFKSEYLPEQIQKDEELGVRMEDKDDERLTEQREKLRAGIRSRLNSFAGLQIPEDWVDVVSIAKEFIKNHDSVISEYGKEERMPAEPESIEGGIRLTADSFEDGMGPLRYAWYCEPRNCMLLGTEPSPRSHTMRAKFELAETPEAGAVLRMEGQNSDKDSPPLAHLAILVNGKEVFSGPVDFERRGWSWLDFPVEPGVLKKGRNIIEVRNITEGPRVKYGRMDHFWFAMSEVQVLFK